MANTSHLLWLIKLQNSRATFWYEDLHDTFLAWRFAINNFHRLNKAMYPDIAYYFNPWYYIHVNTIKQSIITHPYNKIKLFKTLLSKTKLVLVWSTLSNDSSKQKNKTQIKLKKYQASCTLYCSGLSTNGILPNSWPATNKSLPNSWLSTNKSLPNSWLSHLPSRSTSPLPEEAGKRKENSVSVTMGGGWRGHQFAQC